MVACGVVGGGDCCHVLPGFSHVLECFSYLAVQPLSPFRRLGTMQTGLGGGSKGCALERVHRGDERGFHIHDWRDGGPGAKCCRTEWGKKAKDQIWQLHMKYHKTKVPTLATPTETGFEQPTSTDSSQTKPWKC